MSTSIIAPTTVVNCYKFFDAFASCGVTDYTDGMYHGSDAVSYEEAQTNQAEYLLDQIGCKEGMEILDVGCGNGRILEAAIRRGAKALGITISPEQVEKNNARGLPTALLNYRDIPQEWSGRFDGIIANGSIEHFVQLEEAVAGKQGDIYSEMFAIMHRVLKSRGRVATTVIHFRMFVDPREVSKGVSAFKRGSAYYHCARLSRDFGGWYPTEYQLVEAANPFFRHACRQDGTDDYRRTSEDWIRLWTRVMLTRPKSWSIFLKKFIQSPGHTIGFLDDLLISQSWATQFRDWHGQGTPTFLFRDTWERLD